MDRLLIVTPYGTVSGGAEQWILGILRHGSLQAAGWRIDAVVMQDGPLVSALRDVGVTAIAVPIPASPPGIARRVPALRRAILARQPAVVVGNGVKAQLAVQLALTGTGIPTVWVKHDHSHDRVLARPLGRAATLVVPTALEVGLPTGREDLIVIEPPRPPQPLPRSAAAQILKDHGLDGSRGMTLAMVTRLVPYKGVDLAIEALADPRCRNWQLLVIGGDDPATPLESTRLLTLAQHLGVAERVCLAGQIDDGGRLLSAVDAVAVMTRPGQPGAPSKEGYGIVASEAMLAGVPVIVAQPGPISRRISGPPPAGITLAAPTSGDLASALHELSGDNTRAAMGAQGALIAAGLPTQADVARAFTDAVALARDLR